MSASRASAGIRFDDFAALRSALAQARREAAEQRAREAERAAEARQEQELFARTVGSVVPLRQAAVAPPSAPPPGAEPRQRQQDEAQVLAEAISDEFDVESLLDTDDSLSFRRPGIGPEVVKKLRRGAWAIQAQLDLHGLRRDEARDRLGLFLHNAERAGLRCVRVIHGKGNGSPGRAPVLKSKVRSWLVQRRQVIAFTQARACDGGQGALMVLLRPGSGRAARTA